MRLHWWRDIIYSSLDHLSTKEITKIKNRYYQGDSVYRLLGEYNLDIAPSQFYTHLPPDQIEEYGCSRCGVNLVVDVAPRSKEKHYADLSQYYCPICGRKPFAENADWIAFPLLPEEEVVARKTLIQRYYESKIKPVAFDTLPITLKIYLAALCRARLDKNNSTIQPIWGSQISLASTQDLQHDIYSKLIKSGAIIVSPESSLNAFDLESKNFPHKYDKEKVSYKLNLILSDNTKITLDFSKNLNFSFAERKKELLDLWQEIAISECITYLQYRLDKVGFPFSPGEKTHLVFHQLLENFSVSQIYYIIWCKVNDASRWYLEGGVSKQRAANSVINSCLNYGQNAAFYKRELPQYRRPIACPRSILTQVFYNEVLKMGSEADNLCPNSETLF